MAALPASKRRQVYEAFRDHLAAQGTELKQFVKLWQFSQGGPTDDLEQDSWAAENMPLLRLGLSAGASEWRNEVTTRSPLDLVLILALNGTDSRLLMDYWEAVERRLYPGDKSLYAVVKNLGVVAYTMSQPACSQVKNTTANLQVARGTITLNFEIRTAY